MKPTHSLLKCNICRWDTAAKIGDDLHRISSHVSEVKMELRVCHKYTSEDVQAFLNTCSFLAELNNITFKVTKLDVTKMANPIKTINLVNKQFGDTLRQITLNVGGRKVNLIKVNSFKPPNWCFPEYCQSNLKTAKPTVNCTKRRGIELLLRNFLRVPIS